jgi:Zn-dependent protease
MNGNDSRGILIWVVACFVSIVIHEMGHALTIRYFGWTPHIVLYSFGGLAIYDPSFSPLQHGGRRPRKTGMTQILISLAGPGAGFALALLILVGLAISGYDSRIVLFGTQWVISEGDLLISGSAGRLVSDLLYINIYWGLLNLLPIYPLDGGQAAREVFLANSNDGVRKAMMLSFVTAVAIAGYSLMSGQTYLAFMFGYMAYMNYSALSGPSGGSFGGFSGRRPW